MTIIELITKKLDREDNVQALLGTEIKLRRNALSKTLEEISGETCSVSYLSKVENSEIKPNPVFLADICERVKLSADNVAAIQESKAIFQKCIIAIFEHDMSTIEYYYELVFDLKNYRAKMIKLIYALAKDNMRTAKRIISELQKIEGTMQLTDLMFLAFLEAWYNFKNYEFYDCYTLLKVLSNYNSGYIYLDTLILDMIVKILYRLNSPLFYDNLYNLRRLYIKYNAFEKVKDLEILQLTFSLYNGYIKLVDKRIKELKVNFDFRILYYAFKNESIDMNWNDYSFSKMIYLYQMNKKVFKETYDTKIINATEEELKVISFLYDKEYCLYFFERLNNIYLPYALKIKNYFFLNEISKCLIRELKIRCRYKRCLDIYAEIDNIYKERELYC